MLNKRAHILFEEDTYDFLDRLADKEGSSVGELVRKAVKKVYKSTISAEQRRNKTIDKILDRKSPDISPLNTADLVKEGRKFE